MMKKREYKYKVVMVLLMVVIVALVSAMMSSALFGQQHAWYNISQQGNDVPCSKCHHNIYDEYQTTGNIHYRDPYNMSCEDCHRNESGVTYAIGDGRGFQPGEDAHAASIPSCWQCHSDTTGLSSVNEAHKQLEDTSGLNEACVMCHTGFDKSLNFTRAKYLRYNITKVGENWTVEDFEFKESESTIIPQMIPPGDKHTWESASGLDCFECHSDVKSALADGGHVPRSDNTSGSCGGKDSNEGHLGRRHDFNRGSVTIDSCKPCHQPEQSDFGNTTHSEAQLDYHAATTEHCYNCHFYGTATAPGGSGCGSCEKCHDILRTDGNHTDILDSMETKNFCGYQMDKVCVGCHMPGPGYNVPFDNRQFDVYTEPSTTILMIPQP
jgi:nitrate/TMAO reductase-like tetraheme cytochrome c subunit